MPKDFDKTSGPRGRTPSRGGDKPRGRSGAARGPDKKFAKRGFGKSEGGEGRDFERKPRREFEGKTKRDFADRPKRDFSDRPKRDFSDRPKRDFSDRPRRDGDAPRPRFNRDEARPASRGADRKFGERKPYAPRGEGEFKPRGDRSFKPREDRGERNFKPREDRGDRPFKPREDRPRGDRPFKPREDRGERSFKPRSDRPFTPRGDRPAGDRPFKPREDRGERKFGDRPPRKDFGGLSRGPRKDFSERPQSGERKPWAAREDRPRRDDARSERPRGDRPFKPREDRGDRPFKPREDRGERSFRPRDDRGGERPRFSRPREDGPRDERPRGDYHERPRRPRNEWQDHERSERPRSFRDERPRRDNEDESQIFAKRPAFGGRGTYRERDFDERKPAPKKPSAAKTGERIAKLMARAGLCSRRDAELWITQGRVAVNGRVINSPALDVTTRDTITVDGKPLPPPERTRLFLYHKPKGLMTTHDDPEGRPTVFDRLPEGLPRLISVGRLDFNTEGLLLLTNDGGLARALELPDTGWLRRYRVRAHGEVTQGQLDQLKDGVEVDGVKYGPIDAQLERDQGANVWLVFAIREGKNREVRNVMAHLGLEVNRLIRVSYGPFQLGEIEEGQVEEIKTRVLREQLGDKLASASKANFAVPPDSKGDVADDPPVKKAPGKRSVTADRKGRRVLVERSGSDESRARNEEESAGYGAPRRPKRGYHGKRDVVARDE